MCGVVGYITYKKQDISIQNMLALLQHRGPDAQKFKILNSDNSTSICLGHTRLSIQDLSHNAD
jgi:asparagine synthetase B (glutamine-hydrolysing)